MEGRTQIDSDPPETKASSDTIESAAFTPTSRTLFTMDANMSSQIEFFLSAKGLKNMDTFSKPVS